MSRNHPAFPNPIIQEALCEIHFRLPEGREWEASLFGRLFSHIQSEFPEFAPAPFPGIRLQLGPQGGGQALMPQSYRMTYRHAKRNLIIQLSENTLTVNVLPVYPGWEQMSLDITYAWTKAREAINPVGVSRIGLRYINRINRTGPQEGPGVWLAPNDFIPKAVLDSRPGFLARIQARPEDSRRVVVTLGESSNEEGGAASPIILDLDCFVEREIAIDDGSILKEASALHDSVWDIFSASLTPRLTALLNRKDR